MATGLIDIMKRAGLEAMKSSQPTDLRFGIVTSVDPLKIQVTNQFIIPESLLVVPEHLTDYEVDITIKEKYEWKTEPQTMGLDKTTLLHTHTHDHDIKFEKKTMLVHGALKIDDKVVLLRAAGGQSFYILDRLPKEQAVSE